MDNTTVNAIVAIIERRPEDAKSILGKDLDRSSGAAIVARLYSALDKRDISTVSRRIRNLLTASLRIQDDIDDSIDKSEAFFLGVKAVEDLLEEDLKEIQTHRS